jgi:hypothetical protein
MNICFTTSHNMRVQIIKIGYNFKLCILKTFKGFARSNIGYNLILSQRRKAMNAASTITREVLINKNIAGYTGGLLLCEDVCHQFLLVLKGSLLLLMQFCIHTHKDVNFLWKYIIAFVVKESDFILHLTRTRFSRRHTVF